MGVEEAVDEDGPLDADDGEQHVQGDRRQAVPCCCGLDLECSRDEKIKY